MKKKLTVVSLIVLLIAIAVGGTLAWFVDDDEATNVFTIGSIEIEQIEKQREVANGAYTGNLIDFTQDKQLLPVINNDDKNDVNFQDKIVTVKNKGKNAAFVQTFVAVPKALVDIGGDEDVDILNILEGTSANWADPVAVATVKENVIDPTNGSASVDYIIYKYVYTAVLAAGSTTEPVIEGVYINKETDMDVTYAADGTTVATAYFEIGDTVVNSFDANGKINVYVATQAIQEKGFASATAALASFNTHPWVTN